MRWPLVATALVALAAPAHATVLGGGLADTDCTVGFGGVTATAADSIVMCVDGDPTCDVDGAVNGSCRFQVRICTRLPDPNCTPRDVTSLAVAGIPLDTPGAGRTCGAFDTVDVPLGSAVGETLIASGDSGVVDVDYLNLCCAPAATTADAVACAVEIDPSVAGCGQLAVGFTNELAKVRTLVDQATGDPGQALAAARRAAHVLGRMHSYARRLGKNDVCGFSLGLVVSEAQDVLQHLKQTLRAEKRATASGAR
jgi:hypothetical protein